MPATTGASHGLAALVTMVVGALPSKYVWSVAPPLGELALLAIETLRAVADVPLPADEQFAGTVLVMAALSTVWGVFYHLGRHG